MRRPDAASRDPQPPQANRRPLHDAVANRTTRIEHQLAWALGEQPGQAGPTLEGYAPGGAIAGSDELKARLMKPRADGSVDLQVVVCPERRPHLGHHARPRDDPKACEQVTKRAQEKWPKYVSFQSDQAVARVGSR